MITVCNYMLLVQQFTLTTALKLGVRQQSVPLWQHQQTWRGQKSSQCHGVQYGYPVRYSVFFFKL